MIIAVTIAVGPGANPNVSGHVWELRENRKVRERTGRLHPLYQLNAEWVFDGACEYLCLVFVEPTFKSADDEEECKSFVIKDGSHFTSRPRWLTSVSRPVGAHRAPEIPSPARGTATAGTLARRCASRAHKRCAHSHSHTLYIHDVYIYLLAYLFTWYLPTYVRACV